MKKIDITKELKDNLIILAVLPKVGFQEKVMDLSKEISQKTERCCFISLTNPYLTLIDKFKTNKINSGKFFFVDTITSAVKKTSDLATCTFVDSPANLTKLSIIYSDLINVIGVDYAIIDSLQTFLVYRNKSMVVQFLRNLVTKSRMNKVRLLLVTIQEETKENLMGDLASMVDKVIDFS